MRATPAVLRRSLAVLTVLLTSACQTALHQGLSAYERGDCTQAVVLWQPLAEGGDAQAQFLLGLAHDEGRGVARDTAKAAEWYRLAAAQDHALAQNNLGLLHYRGDGVTRSAELAAFWFARAAGSGHDGARSNLGLLQARGEAPSAAGHEPTRLLEAAATAGNAGAMTAVALLPTTPTARARQLLERAAAGGSCAAAFELARRCATDVDGPADRDAAWRWLRLAAEHEHATAQFLLGWSHARGEGVDADPVLARQWFERAAANGQPAALTQLALDALRHADSATAIAPPAELLTRAAEQGFGPAQENLALLLLRGDGVATNRGAAGAWLQLAAEQGSRTAASRLEQLQPMLTATEHTVASRLVDEQRERSARGASAASPGR